MVLIFFYHFFLQVKQCYGPNLDTLQCGHIVGILIDDDNCLHLYVNGLDQGIAARDIPNPCYGLIDLYGQCEQVSYSCCDLSSLTKPFNSLAFRYFLCCVCLFIGFPVNYLIALKFL